MIRNMLIRVDGSQSIGLGHLMRCMLISDYLKSKNVNTLFLSKTEQIEDWISEKGYKFNILSPSCTVEDELNIIEQVRIEKKIRIILLDINNYKTFINPDEYHGYLDSLRKLSLFLISFEDLKDYPFYSDVVVIPYVGAEKVKLHDQQNCKYLLGPKYFILREEFSKVNPINVRKKIENILITMGGSDPEGITLTVLNAFTETELNVNLKILIGGLSQIGDREIKNALSDYNGPYSIIRNTKNMAQLMSSSDIAIINSGLTKYESSAVGLPSIVISNNERHAKLMEQFAKYGSILHLGSVSEVSKHKIINTVTNLVSDYDKRKQMSKHGKSLIDGKGIDRLFTEIPWDLIYA